QISPSSTLKSSRASPTVQPSRENSAGIPAAPEGPFQDRQAQDHATIENSPRAIIRAKGPSIIWSFKGLSRKSPSSLSSTPSTPEPGAQPGAALTATRQTGKTSRFAAVTVIEDSQSESSNRGRLDSHSALVESDLADSQRIEGVADSESEVFDLISSTS